MTKHTVRIPAKGDRVSTPKIKDVFIVAEVRENPRVVNLRLLKGTLTLKDIPWEMLTFFGPRGREPIRCADREAGYGSLGSVIGPFIASPPSNNSDARSVFAVKKWPLIRDERHY